MNNKCKHLIVAVERYIMNNSTVLSLIKYSKNTFVELTSAHKINKIEINLT